MTLSGIFSCCGCVVGFGKNTTEGRSPSRHVRTCMASLCSSYFTLLSCSFNLSTVVTLLLKMAALDRVLRFPHKALSTLPSSCVGVHGRPRCFAFFTCFLQALNSARKVWDLALQNV